MERALAVGGLILFVASVSVFALLNAQGTSTEELARRCATIEPEWDSYQEDVKGGVGAAPVAQWAGTPSHAEQHGTELHVTFELAPPWADYPFAIPVLARDPLGGVHRDARVEHQGADRIYVFALDDSLGETTLPWIELHYPHTERRLALDLEGRWQAK